MAGENPLLVVKDLKKYYPVKGGLIPHVVSQIKAVDGVSFAIRQGETLGLVGESGCGKSTIGRQIVCLERPTAGHIYFNGMPVSDMPAKALRPFRTQVQMVFQDSYSSLNPRKRVFDILAEPMLYHHIVPRDQIGREVDRLLDLVGLLPDSKDRYPHEFSGGQRQRIGIARALSLRPSLLVCDEPVSALDVSIQAQILNLFKNLQKEMKLTSLFIGHGLGAVHYVSNRIAVMYLGRIVEIAGAQELFTHPVHPYAQALCAAVPSLDPDDRNKGFVLQGEAVEGKQEQRGCRFCPRCPMAQPSCRENEPELAPVSAGSGHLVACPVAMRRRQTEGEG